MFEWYWVFVFYLFIIHIRSVVVTIYFHRAIAHGSIEIARTLDEFFKFLTWTVDMYSENYKKEYRAGHIKHHRYSDTFEDPHSPYWFTLRQIVFPNPTRQGDSYFLTDEEIESYTKNIKIYVTWLDLHIYRLYQDKGIWLWHILNFILFGPIAALISLLTLKFVLNNFLQFLNPYLMHKIGYKSTQGRVTPNDKSKNIFPIGVLLGGEELHSNHHNFMSDAKFSKKWWEFDVGWLYIKILKYFKLLTITKDRFNKPNSLTR